MTVAARTSTATPPTWLSPLSPAAETTSSGTSRMLSCSCSTSCNAERPLPRLRTCPLSPYDDVGERERVRESRGHAMRRVVRWVRAMWRSVFPRGRSYSSDIALQQRVDRDPNADGHGGFGVTCGDPRRR
jgi:hypothetical protein